MLEEVRRLRIESNELENMEGTSEVMKQECDKKQQTMLSTLVEKKKELQKQKDREIEL